MEDGNLKRAALLVATFASFLTPFMGASLNIALPTIGKEFNADAISLNWIVTAYILATAIVLLPAGKLADIVGRKKVFSLGIVLFVVASAGCALAPDITWLIILRVFQGSASAMIFATGVAIISSVFPPGERGRALGINVSAVYIGLSAGPFGGGMLTQYLGWRSIFWVTVPLGLFAVLLIFYKLKSEWAEAREERFDLGGSILYGLSLVLVLFGFSNLPSVSGVIYLAAGVMFMAGFYFLEKKLPYPLVDFRLFMQNRTFSFSSLAALINYSATFGVGFLLSLYLQYIKGLAPREAGIVLVSQPLVMAMLSPLSGRLSDRVEPRIVASAGMALSTIGLAMLIFITGFTSMGMIILILLILGCGFALFSSPNTNAIMSSVTRKLYGLASGTVGTMRMIGQMFSMALVLLVFTLLIGKVEIPAAPQEDFMASLRITFSVFAVLCFLGIFFSLARGKMRPEIVYESHTGMKEKEGSEKP